MIDLAEETFGRTDVVVDNAGYGDLGSFEDTTIDACQTRPDTNYHAVVIVSKAAIPVLQEQGSDHFFQGLPLGRSSAQGHDVECASTLPEPE